MLKILSKRFSLVFAFTLVLANNSWSKISLNAPEKKEVPDPISVIRVSETLDANPRLAQKVLRAATEKMQLAYKAVLEKNHEKYLSTLGTELRKKFEPKEVFEALLKEREELKDEKESADESVEPRIKEISRDEKLSKISIQVIFQCIMLNPKDPNKANLYTVVTETVIALPLSPSSSEVEKALLDGGKFEINDWSRQGLVKDVKTPPKVVDEGPFIN